VLGALPDSLIILTSLSSASQAEAQEAVAVGIGTDITLGSGGQGLCCADPKPDHPDFPLISKPGQTTGGHGSWHRGGAVQAEGWGRGLLPDSCVFVHHRCLQQAR
jgi:hypothetical protein